MSGADDYPDLRAHLLAHSVRRGDFVLKSGRRSSWFIDSKQTVCRPEAMLLVADAVLSVIPPEATAIGGLTMGADPVAFVTAAVAATRGRWLNAFSVRKEAKDHGGGGRIAGALDPGDQVVVTEDTVTRGTSLLEAAFAIRDAGAEPILLVAVVDRGGTAETMAAAEGFAFRAILTAPISGSTTKGHSGLSLKSPGWRRASETTYPSLRAASASDDMDGQILGQGRIRSRITHRHFAINRSRSKPNSSNRSAVPVWK